MSETTASAADTEEDREFVGYREAAEYLGIKKGTLSWYMGAGYGPTPIERRTVGQYLQYVFTKQGLDHWQANRPGRGARTDRMHAGAGQQCQPCKGPCTVSLPD